MKEFKESINQNIPRFFKTSESKLIEIEQEKRNKLKEVIFNIFNTYKEQGQVDHVVTMAELGLALGLTPKEASSKLHHAFRTGSLNEILGVIGLPHKEIKETY